ncbi:hypothetical protein [Maribacter sp. 2307ULW6-5]|uniref:hypothetical protein n=1 Tax=Maribacter sp. 2307ULW6-5 TaxID=3386275 RepID=UPI0039BD2D34
MNETESTILDNSKFYLFGIELALVEFKNYQNTIERFLEAEKKTLEESYQDRISKLSKDEYDSWNRIAENYSDRYSDIARIFPHNFRASFLIQIISFIEHELKEICEQYEFSKETRYSINDLKGNNDIEKSRQYLTKSCNVNFDNLNPEWQFILMVKRIRNKLVHHQGFVKKVEKDWGLFNDFNRKKEFFDFSTKGELVESPKLIIRNRSLNDELLNKTERFFKKLLEKELKYSPQ